MKTSAPLILLLPIFVMTSLFLSGCASLEKPPFQKLESHTYGYQVESASATSPMLTVKTILPEKYEPKLAITYASRAVAEECLTRGYEYFDTGVRGPHEVDGYCYKSADHKALGIEFTEGGLDQRPQHFIIDNLNGKTKTELKPKDELIELQGQPVESMAQIKAAVAAAVAGNQKTVDLSIKRDDQRLKVKEPIALFKNSSMSSVQLDLMRSKVP